MAQKRPPCDPAMERAIANPGPVPCGLVVKNAIKIWSVFAVGSPTPVSVTDTNNRPFSANRDLQHVGRA